MYLTDLINYFFKLKTTAEKGLQNLAMTSEPYCTQQIYVNIITYYIRVHRQRFDCVRLRGVQEKHVATLQKSNLLDFFDDFDDFDDRRHTLVRHYGGGISVTTAYWAWSTVVYIVE